MIFDIFLDNIIFSITKLNTIIGLWFPFLLSSFLLIVNKIKKPSIDYLFLTLFVLTLFFNYLTSRIIIDDVNISLTFTDFSMLSILFYIHYKKTKINLSNVFVFSFFSNLIVDIIAAPNDLEHFLYHIGGAGIFDGLVIYPFISIFTFFILNQIRKTRKQELILS